MAELVPSDVETFTKGRLLAENPETARMLKAALAAARDFCGWHVAPERTETLALDGKGGPSLSIPTQRISSITSIDDNGTAYVSADLYISKKLGMVSKRAGGVWSRHYGSISVVLTHGRDGDDAAAFNQAILELVERMSTAVRDSSDLKRKRIDNVEQEWFDVAKQMMDTDLLAPYRLIQSP